MNLTDEHQEESCVHSNLSCSGASPTVVDVLWYMCVAVVVTLTVCGNLLVIISICHFKQLWTPTNFLLLSLAMTDLLVGVIVMPFYFTILLNPLKCFSPVDCIIFNVSALYLPCVSIYNVVLIAVDRGFALSNPFQYSMKMTLNLTLRLIAMLWLCVFIYNMLLINLNGNIPDMKSNITCSECIVIYNKVWAIADFILVFVVPCSMIIIIYLNIFAIAKSHAKKIRSVRKGPEVNTSSMASEMKAAKTLGILVAVFLMCFVPIYVSSVIGAYVADISLHLLVAGTLSLLNSSLNPIIYALFYPWFQRSVKLILTFRICGTQSSGFNVLEREK